MTDDYTLAILPLARVKGENKGIDRCCDGAGKNGQAYRGVLESGVLGYQLHTYHGLVRDWFGETSGHEVRERHIGMFRHVQNLGHMLTMIEGAVGIGAVTSRTVQGEVVTPVEMNVALALLLGLPESPHYVTLPEQRSVQVSRMELEIDWCFSQSLIRGREVIADTFVPIFENVFYARRSILPQ